jgi:hypothetical protein
MFLLSLVEDEARRAENLTLLERFANRADGSHLPAAEATDALAVGRAERQCQLGGPGTGDRS